jgi:hypothetical protein
MFLSKYINCDTVALPVVGAWKSKETEKLELVLISWRLSKCFGGKKKENNMIPIVPIACREPDEVMLAELGVVVCEVSKIPLQV